MSSDGEAPEGRCGFVLEPEDVHEDVVAEFEAGTDEWYEASDAVCCWREVWDGADGERCIWHADTDDKPAEALIDARADRPERLDGASVPAVELGDAIDFEGCGLHAATFHGTGLKEGSFVGIDGHHAQFPDADLRQAQFLDAGLRWAQFPDADLAEVWFSDADLRNVQFPYADLTNAQFPGAILVLAQFPYANLSRAQFPDASLISAKFPYADIINAQFPYATLWNTEFPDADLRGAQFPDADLRDAQFPDTDLQYVELPRAYLRDVQFPDANLQETEFPDAHLVAADLTDATATDATFTGATLERATLTRTDLGGADLTDARLYDAHWVDARINDGTRFGTVTSEEADAEWFDGSSFAIRARLRWWVTLLGLDADDRADRREGLDAAHTVYRTIQRLYRENSMPRRIDTYYVRARDTRRKQAIIDGDLPRWLYLAAQRWVMGYGERPWRVVATSGLVILGCAVAYPLVGGVTETSTGGGTPHYFAVPLPDVLPGWVGLPGVVETVLTSLYFSVVTFTTLGYGDLRPRTGAAQFLATFESLVGAFLMALLVYVLGRRATR